MVTVYITIIALKLIGIWNTTVYTKYKYIALVE